MDRPAFEPPRVDTDSKARLRLWIRLLRTTRHVEGTLRERLRRSFQATLPRFDVLAALHRRQGGMTMTELSRFLMVSNGNVTGIVDRLVEDGQVVRRAVEGDRRATFVQLTPAGRDAFEAMAIAHENWVDELLGAVSTTDAAALGEALKRLEGDGSR